jgi:competence protein ComEA
MEDFIEKYRWYIFAGLILIIIAGTSVLIWNKVHRKNTSRENAQIAELQSQNDALRQELSQPQVAGASSASTSENQSDKININTADATGLDKLPGIGPAKAADIISYRESHGGFKSIEEINNVKGIGDATFEKFKDLITIGE